MDNEKIPKNPQKYVCIICDYSSFNKKDYKKHLDTIKHKNAEMDNMDNKKSPYHNICNCGKTYKYMSGLCKHRKVCTFTEYNIITDIQSTCDDTSFVIKLLKQNDDFKEMIKEQNKILFEQNNKLINLCKENSSLSIKNLTNINSNNKTFNLNVFLNEQCKDAMNIMDFVDSLKLQLCDLESVGKLGLVEGISSIIVKNLKALDIHKRPVHCSDSKREVMYIKDEDKWEKENEEKKRLRKAIKYIAHKNTKLLPEFREKYPNYSKSESKKSDDYNKLVIEAMGGRGDNDSEKEDKIIKNILKEVIIDKSQE